ncbi:MAG TPA: hypothetical protein VK444_02845, partial [Methanobacteriaceae archaeon]|nr:hypothetical protein [Methanobacteriaceae archaeon]
EKNTVSANANSASSGKAEVNAAYKKTYKKTYKRTYTRYKKTYRYSKYRYGKYRYAKAAYKTTYKTSYRGGAYTSGKGVGDCWTNSEYLYNQLVSSGQNARILQYRNSYVSNHRSVQVYQNGAWVDYDYRGNGYSWGYYAQASKPGVKVIKSSI